MPKKVIKICFDTTPVKTGHTVRGIGAYTRNLVEALEKRKDIKIIRNSSLEIRNCDLVHIPYFDLFFDTLRVPRNVPTVVTVYDVIPLIYPKHYPPGVKGRLRFIRQKRKLRDVAAVITISETSKKDIVRFLDVPQERVYRIYLAPHEIFKNTEEVTPLHKQSLSSIKSVTLKYGLPEEFILYVGDVNYNKNVEGLIRAYALLKQKAESRKHKLGLVLVGKAFKDDIAETKRVLHLIEELGVTDQVVTPGFIPEEDLAAIYNLATVYCQPSFYEGFGLPVLEAMAAGCPVVAAKIQALVEIAEGAAIFVDPKDTEDIARGLEEVNLRNKLRKKGMEHVKRFSWDETAEETVNLYKKVLQWQD